jgi:hypothetical protein
MNIKMNKVLPVIIEQPYNKNTPEWRVQNWWSWEKYFIEEVEANKIYTLIDLIKSQPKITPKKGDIIYASKASEIPRFKLKEFIKDNNLKKTSRVGMASVVIINKGYFNELISKLKRDECNFIKEDFMDVIIKKSKNNLSEGVYNIYKNAIDKNKVGFVRQDTNQLKDLLKKYPNLLNEYTNNTFKLKGISVDLYRENRLLELLNTIVDNEVLIQSGKMKFVFDEELFVELNKEGIELDDDYLKTLRDMLFSSDKSNVKLGFEMMSNLVIDQPTLLSMSFLLNELYHTTNFRPSYYVSSNSNLKSLLKVFKTKGIRWESDWKTFGTGLRINFKDGKEGEIVKKFLLDNINREFKLSNSASEALVDIVFTTEAQ